MSIEKFYKQFKNYETADIPMGKMEFSGTLEKEIREGKLCADCNTERMAMGYGAQNPKIMFIGLKVSDYDCDIGIPFRDKVGQKVVGIYEYLNRNIPIENNVYYTNCLIHPVDEPTKVDFLNCRPRLLKEIEIIRPKNLVLFGKNIYNILFQSDKTEVRGVHHVEKIGDLYLSVFVTVDLHNLFYRNDEYKYKMKDDLDFIIEELKNDTWEKSDT